MEKRKGSDGMLLDTELLSYLFPMATLKLSAVVTTENCRTAAVNSSVHVSPVLIAASGKPLC